MQALILTTAQAEAVYSAMCALNNVNALLSTFIRTDTGRFIEVYENSNGTVSVRAYEVHLPAREMYDSQSAFATAYGQAQG